MNKQTLTARQQEVLEFVWAAIAQTGIAPTLREIAAQFRFRGVKAAADHVTALRRKGALTGVARCARGLQVTMPFLRAEAGRRHAEGVRTPVLRLWGRAVAALPLYGSIPAGFADERHQEAKGCVAVDLETLGIRPTPRTFALEVRGDSMIGRHILEGDLVVLEHGRTPRHGEVVAALIDNESTLKTFVQERGQLPHLKAENPKYPKLYPVRELVIQGVMVGLLRRVRN
jgi:repressor LexA